MTTRRTRWLTAAGAGIAGLLAVLPAEAHAGDASTAELRGSVEDVDRASSEITLEGSGAPLTVTDDTQIVKGGERARLSDVKEGDEVRASYSAAGGTLRVSRLEVVEEPAFNDQG